ncbi:MAG: hypothetical protein KGL57_07055 [Burkholderiales bacterium]|nr:hypothetical protein [Burkholderiales bacterium]
MSRLMNVKLFGLAACVLLSTAAYAEGHEHEHAHAEASAPRVQAGKKWATDEVLKSGMDGIRQTMLARRADMDADKLTTQDYQKLGDALEQHTARIVQNCKLSKDADRAFHSVVLADLMRDTELMRTSPKVQIQRLSAQGVMQTLRHYGENFQHPGWSLDAASPQLQPKQP